MFRINERYELERSNLNSNYVRNTRPTLNISNNPGQQKNDDFPREDVFIDSKIGYIELEADAKKTNNDDFEIKMIYVYLI